MKPNLTTVEDQNDLENLKRDRLLFRKISSRIAALAATENVKIVPYDSPDLFHFSKLNGIERKKVINLVKVSCDVFDSVVVAGQSLFDSQKLLWNALLRLNFRPTSDLFSVLNDDHIIEIHDRNLVQVFRNVNFFRYCSYTLEELYCFSLSELYSRDLSVQQSLLEQVQKIFSPESNSVVAVSLRSHTISEILSKQKFQIEDQIHFMAPLFSNDFPRDCPSAVITIETATLVGEAKKPDKLDKPPNLDRGSDNIIQFMTL
jgi:hypothetical protein